MKVKILFIFTLILVVAQDVNAQWRRGIKFGVNSHVGYTPKVNDEIYRKAYTPNNEYERLYSADGSLELNPHGYLDKANYSLFPSFGYYIYTPFILKFFRFETGLEYNPISSRTLYYTKSLDSDGYNYALEELNIFSNLSIPLTIGFNNAKKHNFSRFYLGGKINFTFMDLQVQRSSWDSDIYARAVWLNFNDIANNEFQLYSYSFVFGFTFLRIFTLDFQYVPTSLLNSNYYDFFRNTPYKNLSYPIFDVNLSLLIDWEKKNNKD